MKELEKIIAKYRGEKGMLISALQEVQERLGYLSKDSLEKVSEGLNIPISEVFGVATFYTQFHLKPCGKNVIRVCRGTSCYVRGAKDIIKTVEQFLNIRDGETTDDYQFTFQTVACLGTCFLSPVMMINRDYFGRLTPAKTETVLKSYQQREKL